MTNRDEGGSIGGLLYASRFQFVLYALQDIDRANLRKEGARIAEREAVIARRDQTLRRLNAGEFFPAGHVLLKDPEVIRNLVGSRSRTPTDFVLFEGEEESA
jgi:hypothetical protein